MLDFPNVPAVNDQYQSATGMTWRWDGAKWVGSYAVTGAYLPLAGGVMSGAITLAGDAASPLQAVPLRQVNSAAAGGPFLPAAGGPFLPVAGVTDGSAAAAGAVGEFIAARVASSAPVPIPISNTAVNVTSIALTAGDWTVSGGVGFIGVIPMVTVLAGWISLVPATRPSPLTAEGYDQIVFLSGTSGDGQVLQCGAIRISLAAPATVYLSALVVFTSGSINGWGYIGARRAR